MGTEYWTHKYPCLCGKGHILEHVESPDNPWSKDRYSYELACAECSKIWIYRFGYLENRAAYETHKLWSERQFKVEKEIRSICSHAIDQILADKVFAVPN
jgi:hypothetical protein